MLGVVASNAKGAPIGDNELLEVIKKCDRLLLSQNSLCSVGVHACTHFQTEARHAFGMPNVLLLVQQGHKALLNGDRASVGGRADAK